MSRIKPSQCQRLLIIAAAIVVICMSNQARSNEPELISVQYIVREFTPPPTLSNLEPVEIDVGLQGAVLGIADSNTTGRFLGQQFKLREITVAEGENLRDAVSAAGELDGFIVANLPATDLIALSETLQDTDTLIFNAGAADTKLRGEQCHGNVLHTLPSWAMLSDAMTQFALRKRWTRWLLLSGPRDEDKQFSEAIKQSANKFRTKIVKEITWDADVDLRRTASEEIPLLTNDSDYDLVAVTDTVGDFGRYLPFNTFLPRPIVGNEGLTPLAWSHVIEQWGAAQLQSRFVKQAQRPMRAVDYAAWAAIRSIAEAAAREKSYNPMIIKQYLLSDKFQLAAFKGRKMSFRDWNGQLRQPIPLVHSRAVVALAPIEGFPHPITEMDTLGMDRSASKCEAFSK